MRELEFDGFWEGQVVYTCDCCKAKSRIRFDGEDEAKDYTGHRKAMEKHGWIFTKVNGDWHHFNTEECRNKYIRNNTI